jgi:hypothetical protein
MEIKKVYLLVTVKYNYEKNNYNTTWLSSSSRYKNEWISFISPDGLWEGSSQKLILKPILKDVLWINNIEKIILYKYSSVGKSSFITLCYLLKPSVLEEYFFRNSSVSDKYHENKIHFTNLLSDTFPDILETSKYFEENKDEVFDSSQSEPELTYYKSFFKEREWYNLFLQNNKASLLEPYLIVVPSQTEIINLANNLESKGDFLLRFENMVNRDISKSVEVPYYYFDFIETLNLLPAFNTKNYIRVFICTQPTKVEDLITIPRSIDNWNDFDVIISVLERIKDELPELYANKKNISDYIESLSNKNIFNNYSRRYKNERLNYIQSKFEIEELVNKYKLSVQNRTPYILNNYQDKYLIKNVCNSDHPYSWSVINKKILQFNGLVENLENTLRVITVKDTYINEYIRDIISIESMWGNLKLQKIIRRLTFIAIGIAIASILVTIYLPEVKEFINKNIYGMKTQNKTPQTHNPPLNTDSVFH